jgi:maltose alpha-D-glucosyltransferase/alpha-amylase
MFVWPLFPYTSLSRSAEILLCVATLSRSAQPVELALARFKGRVPIELMGRTPFPPIGDLPYLLTLAGHGFLWFRLAAGEDVPSWHEERLPRDDLPVLVLVDGWSTLFRERVVPWRIGLSDKTRAQLEREALPAFVAGRRWFAAKGERIDRVELADHVEWQPGKRSWLVTLSRAELGSGESQTYFLPMTLAWEDRDDDTMRSLGGLTIAKVRQQAEVGVLGDAFADESFLRAIVQAIGEHAELRTARGRIRFEPTEAFATLAGDGVAQLPITVPVEKSTNTIATIGDRLFVKGYRRLQVGRHAEVEIGRFLTAAGFAHAVPVAGSVEYLGEDGRNTTLALVQGYVSNQGDAWTWTLEYLDRFFDSLPTESAPGAADDHGGYLSLARTLGQRTAELHATFARSAGDAAFDPEPTTPEVIAGWVRRVHDEATAVLDRLAQRRGDLPQGVRVDIDALLARRDALLGRIDAHASDRTSATRTRVHGDYHLGQVLVARNDFIITDFEGEPARTIEERRGKQSPMKDVAGMLRSFDYAMHSALFDVLTERPDADSRLVAAARLWRQQAELAFLDGYDAVAREHGIASSRDDGRGLLELFVLEKAVYELRYEIDNRPDWVRIPVRGLLEALDAPGERPRAS